MNLKYRIMRSMRHILPQSCVRLLLRWRMIIRPGLETEQPQYAAKMYLDILRSLGVSIEGKSFLILGYGGSFATACELLKAGAGHAVLVEKDTPVEQRTNRRLLPAFAAYLQQLDGKIVPKPEYFTVVEGDIRRPGASATFQPVNLILSRSVYEHLDDVRGICKALAGLSLPEACHLHYIDLRDHYFKYPFEMLTFTEKTWKKWFNPGSNLNRYRLWDYQVHFEHFFSRVEIRILARDPEAFERVRKRILPQFISGNDEMDSATEILIIAGQPYQNS